MPVFEYKCKSCGTVSDILVGVTAEEPEVACVECGCTDLVKLLSSFSVGGGGSRFPIASSRSESQASACSCGGACACGGGGCGADA